MDERFPDRELLEIESRHLVFLVSAAQSTPL
jgi:hypothetical protein